MRTNKHGQSIIEYCLIAVLVIIGIVYMGPYVLRSVNAHFKLWDDSAQDSFKEIITQAPINSVPPINTTCQCTSQTENCGGPGLLCPANQREVDYKCNIQGCNGADQPYCINDTSCCSTWVAENCGTYSCPAGGCPSTPTTVPPASNNCYYGYRIWGQLCGTTNSVQCKKDLTCPLPACQGFVLFPDSTVLCGSVSGLTKDTNDCYAGNGAASCSNPKCAGNLCTVYCVPPYVLNAQGNSCVLNFTVAQSACTNASPNAPGTIVGDSSCPQTSFSPTPCCYDSGGTTSTVINNQSFLVCIDPHSLISSVSETPYGLTVTATETNSSGALNPVYNGGCGNPGEPTQTCAVSVSF